MRTRDKQRIFKRLMNGESVFDIVLSRPYPKPSEVEQAIRDVVNEKEKKQ